MDEELKKIFAGNLKRWLQERDKSQVELAKYMKVSSPTVSDWVNGKKMPRADKLQSISNWLSIDLSDLLMNKGDNSPEQDSPYYLNPKTAQIAQQVFDDPNLRILFDAARDVKPENIRLAAEMLKRFKETNPNG